MAINAEHPGARSLRELEDILDRATKQDTSRVLDVVLDSLLPSLGAEFVVLFTDGVDGPLLTRVRARDTNGRNPEERVTHELVRQVFDWGRPVCVHPPESSRDQWRVGIPVHRDRHVQAALFAGGSGALPPFYSNGSSTALIATGTFLSAALLVDELKLENRRLLEDLNRSTHQVATVKRTGTVGNPDGDTQRPLETRLQALFPDIVAGSAAMRRLLNVVGDLAPSDIPILIEGESGTGKELVASAIHHLSSRSTAPFISENCGAIPDSLVEAELFGYEKGAFTGATSTHPGLLERAHGGTLFLDEIGEMSMNHQKKLLRVLQEHRVRRLGARDDRPVDFRIISATNRVLEELVSQGRFREDLFYRLQAATISIPALRERSDDCWSRTSTDSSPTNSSESLLCSRTKPSQRWFRTPGPGTSASFGTKSGASSRRCAKRCIPTTFRSGS